MMTTNVDLRPTVNEQSMLRVDVVLVDENGDPAVPQSITYRVDCVDTGAEMVGDTPIAPASSFTIRLGVAANTISAPAQPSECHRLTVRAVFGADDHTNEQFDYRVLNLGGV